MSVENNSSSIEFSVDFVPHDEELFTSLQTALSMGVLSDIADDGLLDFEVPVYNPDIEQGVRFLSRYPRIMERFAKSLDTSFILWIKNNIPAKDLDAFTLLFLMKHPDEEVKKISELKKGDTFIHIAKVPRDGNEYTHQFSKKVKGKSGKKTVTFGLTVKGEKFLNTHLVLVKQK